MNIFLKTVLLASALIVGGCSDKPSPIAQAKQAKLKTVDLQQEWFPFAGFAGEVSGSKRFAAQNGIKLNVLPGSEQVDPIKLVLAGTAKYGVVSADLLATAVAKGAPLVAIGVVNNNSPTIFIVPEKSRIKTPSDFVGQRVGVLPGTNTERIYQLMMARGKINRKKIKEVQIPFDLQTYLLDQYDVRPAFIYDEPVSLEQKGFGYRVIKPEDYGVVFPGTVYFTTKETLNNDRATTVSLLKTLIQGWQFAIEKPQESIGDLAQAHTATDQKRELRALEIGKPYFAGWRGQPLQVDAAVWQKLITGLEEIGELKTGNLLVEQIWDPSALNQAYKEMGKVLQP